MLRIVRDIISLQRHVEALIRSPESYRPSCCPACGLRGLWAHGRYERKADRGNGKLNPVEVPRYICGKKGGCGATCSTLPSCVSPRRWYDWAAQATVLRVMLDGASVRACAFKCRRAQSTVRRWWRWLRERHDVFAFHLLTDQPEWGRTGATWAAFWSHALSCEPLQQLMVALDRRGLIVP